MSSGDREGKRRGRHDLFVLKILHSKSLSMLLVVYKTYSSLYECPPSQIRITPLSHSVLHPNARALKGICTSRAHWGLFKCLKSQEQDCAHYLFLENWMKCSLQPKLTFFPLCLSPSQSVLIWAISQSPLFSRSSRNSD